MDGTSLAVIIPSVMGGVLGLIGIYQLVVKNNTQIKVDDATLIRSNLIPTTEWLRREAELNERLRAMDIKIDKQRTDYEARLDEKDAHIELISDNFRREIASRDGEIEKLKDALRDLKHRMGNVEQAEQFKKDGLL